MWNRRWSFSRARARTHRASQQSSRLIQRAVMREQASSVRATTLLGIFSFCRDTWESDRKSTRCTHWNVFALSRAKLASNRNFNSPSVMWNFASFVSDHRNFKLQCRFFILFWTEQKFEEILAYSCERLNEFFSYYHISRIIFYRLKFTCHNPNSDRAFKVQFGRWRI